MADGYFNLGAALGGDSEKAYQEGRQTGARTEDLLAQAAERAQKNAARQRLKQTAQAAGVPEQQAALLADAAQGDVNLGEQFGGLLKNQELGFNERIADPNVPLDVAQRLVLTKSTNPVEPLYKVGGGYANKFDTAGGLKPLGDEFGGAGNNEASAIQVLKAFGLIDPATGQVRPEDREKAFNVYRDTVRNVDAGGVPLQTMNNPFGGPHIAPVVAPSPAAPTAAPTASVAPVAAPATVAPVEQVASNVNKIASAKAQGEATGKNAASLPTALNTLDTFSKDIDNLVNSKGFDSIYGARVGTAPGQAAVTFLDQDAADAAALRKKVNAEAFRASINSMRGLGQLSNAEGEKVQAALTTLADPHLSPDAARQAAHDLKVHLAELKRVAQIEAGQAQGMVPGSAGAAPVSLDEYLKSKGF